MRPVDLVRLLDGGWADVELAAEQYHDHEGRILAFADRRGWPANATAFFDVSPLARRAAVEGIRARRLAHIYAQEELGNVDVAAGMRDDLADLMAALAEYRVG